MISNVENFAISFTLYNLVWIGTIWFQYETIRAINMHDLGKVSNGAIAKYVAAVGLCVLTAGLAIANAFWATIVLSSLVHILVSMVSRTYRERASYAYYGGRNNVNLFGFPKDWKNMFNFYNYHITRNALRKG